MIFESRDGKLFGQQGKEHLCIEPWGKDSLRLRATRQAEFIPQCWALTEVPVDCPDVEVIINADGSAAITNGKMQARISARGQITYYKDGKLVLQEHDRIWDRPSPQGSAMVKAARTYSPIIGGDFAITQRFEAQEGEKFYGMGQYQQPCLNLKGCILEMAQRNTQVCVPFAVSSLGYGLLWNNPAVGEVVFGNNYTQYSTRSSKQLEYWITAGDTPAAILENYTAVTGRAPMMPEDVMGFWQCKLRYRTQEELLNVAREYKRRGIPLDVIIIDFFHWRHQGDWSFDPKYWPDPKAMVEELKSMGIRLMVSVWPTVEPGSDNYDAMSENGYLIDAEHGVPVSMLFQGKTLFFDATNPGAQAYLWNQIKKNYREYGIDLFWLDVAEPEYTTYDYDNYRYHLGPVNQVGNYYPCMYVKTFDDGMKADGMQAVTLSRAAWAGAQRYGAVAWSGDIPSTYEAFRNQMTNGLNIGMAGIAWWNTDIGGFSGGDISDPAFRELLVRWFQFGAFSPIMRLHGSRLNGAKGLTADNGGEGDDLGFPSGADNEIWSFGDEAYEILKHYIQVRYDMHDYIKKTMQQTHETGAPVMRPMFFNFPQDEKCWELWDQYMFGDDYLVAPVLYPGMTSREVYLPEGQWKNVDTGEVLEGGRTITAPAPLEIIPVFCRV